VAHDHNRTAVGEPCTGRLHPSTAPRVDGPATGQRGRGTTLGLRQRAENPPSPVSADQGGEGEARRVWSQVEPSDWDASDCGGQRPKRSDPQLDNPASAGRAWGAWRPITTTMKKPRSAGQARLFGCQTNRLSVSWCSRRRQRCSPGERQSPCCRGTRRRQHHRNRRARSRWRIPPNLPW